MHPERHIVWSKNEINLNDPWQKRWYIKQVLIHGRAEDIKRLNWEEVRMNLEKLDLPPHIKFLWENYFNAIR